MALDVLGPLREGAREYLANRHQHGTIISNTLAGIYWTAAAVWTFIALIITGWFYIYRKDPSIRYRSVPLTVLTIWSCTVIIVFNMIQYPLNGTVPCDAEYWIYSLIFPLCAVLLQAKNVRLYLLFASNLNAYLKHKETSLGMSSRKVKNYVRKGWIYTILIHVLATGFIYTFSTRFNPLGVIKGSNFGNKEIECHDGWEWYPKHIGLIVYTYIVGPILLYVMKRIEDTHYMKHEIVATMLSSWASLPIFITCYKLSSLRVFNAVFPPLQWFNISLIAICIICFAFPAHEMNMQRKLKRQEEIQSRDRLLEVFGVNISSDFAKILSDPVEYQKFSAFTVRDLCIENTLFFEKIVMWRREAEAVYSSRPTDEYSHDEQRPSLSYPADNSCNSTEQTYNLEQEKGNDSKQNNVPLAPGIKEPVSFLKTNSNVQEPRKNNVFLLDTSISKALSDYGSDRYDNPANINNLPASATHKSQDRHTRVEVLKEFERRRAINVECKRLVQEFVTPDAQLSINITSATRSEIFKTLESAQGAQIVNIFDNAIREIIELMYTNSYLRYLDSTNNAKRGMLLKRKKTDPSQN